MADINLEGAQKTVADAKAIAVNPDFQADAVYIDVSVEDSVKKAVANAVNYLGRIDYAVNSAGVSLLLVLIVIFLYKARKTNERKVLILNIYTLDPWRNL